MHKEKKTHTGTQHKKSKMLLHVVINYNTILWHKNTTLTTKLKWKWMYKNIVTRTCTTTQNLHKPLQGKAIISAIKEGQQFLGALQKEVNKVQLNFKWLKNS